ncbi:MAG: DNA polymerase III subunit gamma/tau [Campylobacterales bacterium]|nr:DNA polymerase III subunit gamma/tau [Campylobacterales bacterium]
MSLALARKYRPATFNDLIGQEAVSETLSLSLESKRLSHAYLFSGLRGSGKTSTARIFAKSLLCEKGTTSHPCGECIHCQMATENRHMDIIEMDAASNRGIDDIKDLIEHTKYKPSSARYKIFIIDEVHMLTTQAFNALLKTLEEPPDFVKFILATTDPLKLPATILSRTQHFRFKKIPQQLVRQHLEHILNLENIGYETEALEIIARSGAGSLRDSLTLLDQAIVYSKNFVDVETVTGMLGIIEPSLLANLLEDIIQKDRSKVLAFIKMAADYETEMILDELTLYLKELLLSHHPKLSPMIIERFFRVIAEAKSLLALGSDGEFVLTLSLFKMMESLEIREIDAMIRSLKNELQGVQIHSSAYDVQDTLTTSSSQEEVITITQDEILSAMPIRSAQSTTAKTEEPTSQAQEIEPIHYNLENEREVTEISEATVQIQQPSDAPKSALKNSSVVTYSQEKQTDSYEKTFETLIEKIFDRDFELGACFEANITYGSFQNGRLTWHSTAEGEEKKLLITHWGLINMFVKELFGFETKIVNIAQPSTSQPRIEEDKKKITANPNEAEVECNASSSMIEDVEMKSSCIAPEAGETEAAKEKNPSTILEEPMIKEAIALFDPKKVRIKLNS